MSSCVSTVLLLWGLVLSASATGQEQRPQTRCQVTGPLVISRPTRRIRTSRLSAAIAPRRHRVRDGQTSGRGTRDAGRGHACALVMTFLKGNTIFMLIALVRCPHSGSREEARLGCWRVAFSRNVRNCGYGCGYRVESP